ncbi:MAG: DUF2156 domain-containing protein [Selenomonadaceae bacterium]|nr:DUF2156 domain-containing protein [Selenomonadaceae bacterium]
MEFKNLEKADKKIIDKFYNAGYYENSEHNFTNLYIWRNLCNIQWTVEDEVLFISSSSEDMLAAWQPVGQQEKMQDAITKILDWAEKNKGEKNFSFVIVEKNFTEELKKYPHANFEIEPDRNEFDYVYLAEDLINLSGRKYHGKKNHLNSFRKEFPTAEYLPITSEIIPKCRDELNRWYEIHKKINPDDPFICYEQAAIHEIFDNFDEFKLKGGAILLDGKVIAFTFGEKLNSDTAVIHVEKANPEIRGAYTAINQNFVAAEWSDVTFINRESDMGLEGLRQAKESYRPVKLIEKFNARVMK